MTGPDIHTAYLEAGHAITDNDGDTLHIEYGGPLGRLLVGINDGEHVLLAPADLPALIVYLTAVLEASK